MAATRTGNFPIGFRRTWGDWQRKDLPAVARWAKEQGFESLDLGWANAADIAAVRGAGLRLGSVDLLDFARLMDNDPGVRREAVGRNVAYVKECSAAGATIFFTCVVPGDPTRPRGENYALAVECFGPVVEAVRAAGAVLVVEGAPGKTAELANLCCTPETCRRFIADLGADAVGINYDPSHLIRLGVDPLRFLREFAPHVHHIHAKDTELLDDAAYEFGRFQPAAFSPPRRYGGHAWRYTLPGRGQVRWTDILTLLVKCGYSGVVSVELEDEDFNGTEDSEKTGLLESLKFLQSA